MEKILIEGGIPLRGRVKISGSKNSALPILSATILAEGKSTIYNIPHLRDIDMMLSILRSLGANIEWGKDALIINTDSLSEYTAPYEFVSKMRASISLLGPLLSRFGKAKISFPGGCVIGSRPVDIHIKGLQKLGASIDVEKGYINATAKRLKGSDIFLGGSFGSSVLGTANLMMAAVKAEGETVIESAACEPEIIDLANFLKKMGAHISGEGSPFIRIKGVKELKGVDYRIIPDRIEAGTYCCAAAITKGDIFIEGSEPKHSGAVIDRLEESGVEIDYKDNLLHICRKEDILRSVDITTLSYPGFPTDMQAQFMALMCLADGVSVITEKVFPERFIHAGELNRMGAEILVREGSAIVRGNRFFVGTKVMASDLRASAALILAGLAAEGETEISRVYHLDRGYEKIEEKLSSLGARIRRVS